MPTTFFKLGRRIAHGCRLVWLVDAHGCLLHTEPVCTVNTDLHPWFIPWLEQQSCPVKFSDPLAHDEEKV